MLESSRQTIVDMALSIQADVGDLKLDVRETLVVLRRLETRVAALVRQMDVLSDRDARALRRLDVLASRLALSV